MGRQRNNTSQKSQRIWISRERKEVFLSEVRGYDYMEFKKYEELIEYVLACTEGGYKIG